MSDPRAYMETISRLEPEIAMIDAGAAGASIAISLRRIADSMEKLTDLKPNEYGEIGMEAITGPLRRELSELIGELGMTLRQNK